MFSKFSSSQASTSRPGRWTASMPATISATSERKQSKGAWDLEWIQLTQLTSSWHPDFLWRKKEETHWTKKFGNWWKLMETDGNWWVMEKLPSRMIKWYGRLLSQFHFDQLSDSMSFVLSKSVMLFILKMYNDVHADGDQQFFDRTILTC